VSAGCTVFITFSFLFTSKPFQTVRSSFLRHDAVSFDELFTTFRRIIVPSSSGVSTPFPHRSFLSAFLSKTEPVSRLPSSLAHSVTYLLPSFLFIGKFFSVRCIYMEDGRDKSLGYAGTCILNYTTSSNRRKSRGPSNYSTVINLIFVDWCIIVQFVKKFQHDATMYQNFIIPYLYEAQHVSGDRPPIIRSLKLHRQPLVFHTWKVVGRVVGGCCQAQYDTVPNNYDVL